LPPLEEDDLEQTGPEGGQIFPAFPGAAVEPGQVASGEDDPFPGGPFLDEEDDSDAELDALEAEILDTEG